MYIIGVYDINEKRVNKVKKVFDKYMERCQFSVYTGNLKLSQYKQLQSELRQIIDKKEDSVIFFTVSSEKYVFKNILGNSKNKSQIFL